MALVSIFVAVCTFFGVSVIFNFLCEFLPVCFIVVCVGSAVLLDFVFCLCFVGDPDWHDLSLMPALSLPLWSIQCFFVVSLLCLWCLVR